MRLQLTNFAVSQLDAATTILPLSIFKLGDAYNYIPLATDTDLHGTQVYSGTLSPGIAENANVVKYSCYLDYNTGDFDFGEVALMYEGQLFALGVADALIHKIRVGTTVGNSVRLDIFISMVGTNYGMWVDVAESDNRFRVAALNSPDQLPPSEAATPNVYIIPGADSSQNAYLAYTDRNGLWSFDAYQYTSADTATITGFDSKSVSIALADFLPEMSPDFWGEVVIEFASGNLYSICRYVKTCVTSGSTVTFGFDTTLAETPVVGDKILMFRRTAGLSGLILPVASTSQLGGIKIGSGLVIDDTGVLSVIPGNGEGSVASVNGKTGAVVLIASDITGLALVAKSGDYNDLINKPAAYSLPAMSLAVRGGAKLPTSGNLVMTGDMLDLGFPPVKTINGVTPNLTTGDVAVVGLVNPQAIPANANLNSYTTAGLFTVTNVVAPTLANAPAIAAYFSLEVIPLLPTNDGECIQRASSDTVLAWRKGSGSTWTTWQQVATNAIATVSSLGVVKVGNGLTIDATGNLTPRIATATATGIVKVGSGLQVDVSGLLSLNAPIASATILGMVKVGTGLAIDVTGLLSVSSASLPLATTTTTGVMSVGTGLQVDGTGKVSVNTTALAAATASGAGVVKVGAGLSAAVDGTISANLRTVNGVSPDAGGNVVVSAPIATTGTVGTVSVGAGLAITGAGVLTANVRTVNSASPDASGNVVVTVPADATKLNVINGTATGLYLTFNDLGTLASGAAPVLSVSAANVQAVTFSGGTAAWTINGWPSAGTYGEIQAEVINGGLSTHTFPAAVHWVNPDGTFTTSFAVYIGNKRAGATNFQTSGTDFAIFWSRNGGATVYAMVM